MSDLERHVNRLLDELAEDAQDYLRVLREVRDASPLSEERLDREGDLYALLTVLKIHAEGAQKAIDELTEAEPVT
jgi:hypothetical protein